MFGGRLKHLPPLLVGTPHLPFGDGTIGLPWNYLVHTDLRCRVDGLFIMPCFGQRLNQSEFGDGLRLLAEARHLRDSLLRVAQHRMDAQSPTIGKLQLITVFQTHGLNGVATHRLRQRQFPSGVQLIAVHRHIIMFRIKQKKGISHSSRDYQHLGY